MTERTVALVKELSKGRCSCYWRDGSASISTWDPMTGKVSPGHYDPGTKVTCLRCQAREALDHDGVEYEKIDHVPMLMRM